MRQQTWDTCQHRCGPAGLLREILGVNLVSRSQLFTPLLCNLVPWGLHTLLTCVKTQQLHGVHRKGRFHAQDALPKKKGKQETISSDRSRKHVCEVTSKSKSKDRGAKMRVIFSPSMAARSFECGGMDRRQTLVPVDYEALSLSVVLERSHISDVTVRLPEGRMSPLPFNLVTNGTYEQSPLSLRAFCMLTTAYVP